MNVSKFAPMDATHVLPQAEIQKLYEDLRIYSKLTDVAMSEVIIAGTRAELERRKKKYGI